MAVPVILGPPAALTSNSATLDDYGSLAGLTGGNLATASMRYDPQVGSTKITVQIWFGDTLRALHATTLDVAAMGIDDLPVVTALPSGGFAVTWTSEFSILTGRSIWEQVYDATGHPVGIPRLISEDGRSAEIGADASGLAGGGHVVAFSQFTPGTAGAIGSWDACARLVGEDGQLGALVPLNSVTGFDEGAPRVIGLADGGFLSVWIRNDADSVDGPKDQLIFRRFDAAGIPLTSEVVRLEAPPGTSLNDIDLTRMDGGQIAVTWHIAGLGLNQVVSQLAILSPNGQVILPGYEAPANGHSAQPQSLALNDGRLLFTWTEIDFSTGLREILGALVTPDGSVSDPFALLPKTQNSGIDYGLTELADGRVALSYSVPDASGRPDTMRQIIDPREARIVLTGSDANDAWLGTRFDDVLTGNGGNDRINGGSGNDRMHGGLGDDSLTGANGNDRMIGWAGNDTLRGGAGNDLITGETGNDSLFGDAGNDTLNGSAGLDTMTGGLGADTFVLTASRGRDVVTDYQLGTDDIDLRAFAFASLDAAKAAFTQVSGGTLLKVGTVEVLFTGLDASLLQSTDVLL